MFKKKKSTCIRVFADVNQINACKAKLEKVDDSVKLLANALSLAGNEVRMKILYLLHDQQKLCVCDLSDVLEMSTPAVSQHLRKMKDGGVISNEKVGQTIFYTINPEYSELLKPLFDRVANNKVLEKINA